MSLPVCDPIDPSLWQANDPEIMKISPDPGTISIYAIYEDLQWLSRSNHKMFDLLLHLIIYL